MEGEGSRLNNLSCSSRGISCEGSASCGVGVRGSWGAGGGANTEWMRINEWVEPERVVEVSAVTRVLGETSGKERRERAVIEKLVISSGALSPG